jgi:hypothetical protein
VRGSSGRNNHGASRSPLTRQRRIAPRKKCTYSFAAHHLEAHSGARWRQGQRRPHPQRRPRDRLGESDLVRKLMQENDLHAC